MNKAVFPRSLVWPVIGMFTLVLWEAQAELPPPPPLLAMPITLAWNAADDPTVSGYALYYGLANQPATNRVDAGASTAATIFGLHANLEYRIYAVSYNAAGLESSPSNELLLTPPAVSRLRLARQPDGSMRLSGKAAPGTLWTVQFTPALESPAWESIAQTTADQAGNFVAIDGSATQVQHRYYRVVLRVRPVLVDGSAQ